MYIHRLKNKKKNLIENLNKRNGDKYNKDTPVCYLLRLYQRQLYNCAITIVNNCELGNYNCERVKYLAI